MTLRLLDLAEGWLLEAKVKINAGLKAIDTLSALVTYGANAYIEGTFTPVLSFGGASTGIAYTTQTGVYTRAGRVVHIVIVILLSSKGAAAGSMSIAGLPFTVSATCCAPVQANTLTAGVGDTHLQATFTGAATTLTVQKITAGAGTLATLADTDFTNTSLLRIAGSYTI